jgi:uncharacterized lipoprotein YajG
MESNTSRHSDRASKTEKAACRESGLTAYMGFSTTLMMKKYICILASAALLAACEQKTETAAPAPAATAAPEATSAPATTESTTTTAESPAATPTP